MKWSPLIVSLSLVPNNNNLINIMQVLLSFIKYKQENISFILFLPLSPALSVGKFKTEQIFLYIILEANTIVLGQIQTEFITEQVISKNVRKS